MIIEKISFSSGSDEADLKIETIDTDSDLFRVAGITDNIHRVEVIEDLVTIVTNQIYTAHVKLTDSSFTFEGRQRIGRLDDKLLKIEPGTVYL